MSKLWRRIERYIRSGKESPKVDFKRELVLKTKAQKSEFAKDVMAIANTPGGDGYLLIGVDDTTDQQKITTFSHVVGFQSELSADHLHIQMIDALNDYCSSAPTLEFDEVRLPDHTKTIGVVTIKRSNQRPHSFRKDCESGQQNQIPIRRGTKTFPQASVEELREMMAQTKGATPTIVINLSGHPLSENQKERLEQEIYIEELIEIVPHFGTPPILPQIESLVNEIGLTGDEWQNSSILLIPPGFAPASVTLIAYLHGLRGGFLRIAWVRPNADDKSRYNIDELIPLQDIRDSVRSRRNEF